MTAKDSYDWDLLYAQVVDGIKNGKCKTTWVSISEYIEVPNTTIQSAFKKRFGLSAKDLPGLAGSRSTV